MSMLVPEDEPGLAVDIALKVGTHAIEAAFETPPAGITALFGPSGAGKTSILHAIAGLLRPREGRISLGHRMLFDSFARTDLAPEKRAAGVVFQDDRLFPHKSVRGNLLYGAGRLTSAERREALKRTARLLGIEPLLERRPAGLSGGERRRVAIGRALLASPRILLLDEPLTGLDSARREDVLSHVARIARAENIPILYITHRLDEVLRLADSMVMLEDGKVTAQGAVGDVLNDRASGGLIPPNERATVIEGLVESAGGREGLSLIETPLGLVQVVGLMAPARARVRLRLRAADVSLALSEPRDISINNVLPGHVLSIAEDGPAACLVTLDTGAPLLARITRQSVQRLSLAPGMRVYALIKAVAVERVFIGALAGS